MTKTKTEKSEKMQQKSANIEDIVKLMARANESFNYEIYVPSLQKNVMFREITTSQQKRLIKAVVDSPAYNTEFIFTFRQIIEENCAENIDVDSLTIYDKLMIALIMRCMSISPDFTISFTAKSGTNVPLKVDLNDIVKQLKDLNISHDFVKFTDEKEIFTVECGLPTIKEEFALESELRKNDAVMQITDEVKLRKVLGDIFVGQLAKYVKRVSFKKDDGVVEINFDDLNFKQRISVIESLPAKLMGKIVDFISSIEKQFETVFIIKGEFEGKPLEQRLKIDASFFTNS